MSATASAVVYIADCATLMMALHKGRAFYFTNINGVVKSIQTSKVTATINTVGKYSGYLGFVVDVLFYVSGNQSGVASATSIT